MYIWQNEQWPEFQWQQKKLEPLLEKVLEQQALLLEDRLEALQNLPGSLDREAEMDALIQNAIKTSRIEGEELNVDSVRSSVARQLGLDFAGMSNPARQDQKLVAMLCAATDELEKPLNSKTLFAWQAALFDDNSTIRTGQLRGEEGMQVISYRRGKPVVHFEAPPFRGLKKQLNDFCKWFNETRPNSHNRRAQKQALLRAGLAHLYLITLHPFEDGNGRVSRAVNDRALAQAEATSVRFYALSNVIEKHRKAYYQILEKTQSCQTASQQKPGKENDVTEWLHWFLQMLHEALEQACQRIDRVLLKAQFWQRHAQTVLTARQLKVLNRLLDTLGEEFRDGLAARHYQAIAKVSKATATRDLADLVEKNCLKPMEGGGRSVRYGVCV